MKKRLLTWALSSLLLGPLASAQTMAPAPGSPLELISEKAPLKGTLLLPVSQKPVPVVLLISGSGPTDRDGNNPAMKNNSLKMVAEALQAQGIASVRYDKRGIAESTAAAVSEFDLRFDHYVQDAAAWVQKLKEDKRFSKVVVLGHSEGSLIGMMAARQAKADGFISVAGVGQTADQVIREQLQAQPQQVKDAAFPILDQLAQGKAVTEVNPMLAALFRPSVQPYLISWFKQDPQAELRKLTVPVLLVQGTQDLQVSRQEVQLLAAASPKSKLVEIENMNHVLKETTPDRTANFSTYANPTLPLAPPLMPAVVAFVKSIK
ncbi:alpha/beta hydrolase [Rufibacter glacialis]|uniref:Alpha/beta hydrolase n=1 Tax=Rufibacter glacialis TaxID=1259555 RepID=A0A5M8QHL2_9BACT|nr:alpha/beta fold hydrolase [Rufibacter glacialis]KAA6434420.1 lysophospholipase [Rufibacter glacialis]GGK69426.1 alpha/beta hydrolase [Rufibacter glacialis]